MGTSGGKLAGLRAIAVVLALISGAMAVAVAPVGAASPWSIASSPSPFRPDQLSLSAVSCADAATCFAVGSRSDLQGYRGTGIVIEQWNGTTWSTVVGPVAGGRLSAVTCATATMCFAVGGHDPGTLIEQWDGTSWSTVASPSPNGTQGELNGVACWSANGCIAVGDWPSGKTTKTLVERWDGASWHIDASPNPSGAVTASLSAVSCPNATSCFAVGRHAEAGDYQGGALLEHWNGTAWNVQPLPTPKWHPPTESGGLLITPLLDGVSCAGPRSCMAVGYTTTDALVERWNGTKWSLVPSPHPPSRGTIAGLPAIATLRAVDCASANDCTTVGVTFVPLDYREGVPLANSIAEHWNGKAWTIVARPPDVPRTFDAFSTGELTELSGVSCPAANQCAAVGNSARAERWNGAKWSLAPLAASTSYSLLQSVACPSATTCFAVGYAYPLLEFAEHPLIERWDGTTWSVVAGPTITGTNVYAWLNSISCVTAADCTAVGYYHDRPPASSNQPFGLAFIEHWNGSQWSRVPGPPPSRFQTDVFLSGVDCTSATDCNAVGTSTTYDKKHGTVEHPLAVHWNGAKWSIVALPGSGQAGLAGISCPSPTSCVAVGGSIIDRWDGAHWTAIAVPKSAVGVAYTLTAVSCPSTTDCTAVGMRYAGATVSTLIEHWNGTSWSITPSPTPTSSTLDMNAVSCTSATSCTAVGAIDEFARTSPNPTQAAPLIEHWDGITWSIAAGATPALPITGTSLFGVTCTDQTGCIAVGAGWGGTSSVTNNTYTEFTENSYTLVERDA